MFPVPDCKEAEKQMHITVISMFVLTTLLWHQDTLAVPNISI